MENTTTRTYQFKLDAILTVTDISTLECVKEVKMTKAYTMSPTSMSNLRRMLLLDTKLMNIALDDFEFGIPEVKEKQS